jgi:hypothetical protein
LGPGRPPRLAGPGTRGRSRGNGWRCSGPVCRIQCIVCRTRSSAVPWLLLQLVGL